MLKSCDKLQLMTIDDDWLMKMLDDLCFEVAKKQAETLKSFKMKVENWRMHKGFCRLTDWMTNRYKMLEISILKTMYYTKAAHLMMLKMTDFWN